jgi:hypothetical protein
MLSPSSFFLMIKFKNVCLLNFITLTKISINGFKPNVIEINEQNFYQQIAFFSSFGSKKDYL